MKNYGTNCSKLYLQYKKGKIDQKIRKEDYSHGVTLKDRVERLTSEVAEEVLKEYKNSEIFSYNKTRILITKAISIYSIKLAKLVKEQMILDEIERSQKEREEK